jgi:GH15 family glucan-1,4-alpha-glucosidase
MARIEDYALIGDCRSAALVSREGSIDWLCLPRFDSGACFAALLGTPENGRWRIGPAGNYRATRAYRPGTLVLETEFETAAGRARLVDCMVPGEPHARLLRQVEGIAGEVELETEIVIRFDYGHLVPWVKKEDGGITAIGGPDALRIRSDVPLHGENFRTRANFRVTAGQRRSFELIWYRSYEVAPRPLDDPGQAIARTAGFWLDWIGRSRYRGPWKEAVDRSLLTLKALTNADTGGIVAAPTTSLPEQLGGPRNWDYRFCWLRDATFTLFSLLNAGYRDEARAWREWLLRAIAGRPSDLNIMYGLAGERRLTELTLDWLPGYERSCPVRVGNAAVKQRQWDIYGEVMDALHLARREAVEALPAAWRIEKKLLDYLESHWEEPDEGIWEVRGPRRQFTHSKMMLWVALDRGIRSVTRFKMEGPVDRWRALRARIHADVCRNGYHPEIGAFTQSYGSPRLDASLLMMAPVGFLPPSDPRLRGTVRAIQQGLMRDGFVLRYSPDADVDGMPGGEGAFLACTFWLADNLCLLGEGDQAREIFERLLSIRNDVGLLAEEYDPRLRRQLGNFPQAFSHVALINSAFNLTPGHAAPVRQRRVPEEEEAKEDKAGRLTSRR